LIIFLVKIQKQKKASHSKGEIAFSNYALGGSLV